MKKIKLNEIEYELIEDFKDGFNEEEVQTRYTDYFEKYDYVIGDWSYGKLRLKGFCDKDNKGHNKFNDIKYKDEYIKNDCAHGCKYFVLKKIKVKSGGFTLLELLAVIVILAIISMIAIPNIIDIVNNAKKNTVKASVYNIISAAELAYNEQLITNEPLVTLYEFIDGNFSDGKTLSIKLDMTETGIINLNSNENL